MSERSWLLKVSIGFRLRLHESGLVSNRYKIGTFCVYTRPGISALNGLTCQSDPVWNYIVPCWYHSRVPNTIQENLCQRGSGPNGIEPH